MTTIITPFHDWLVDLRRFFHQHPELSYQEERTAEKISQTLQSLGIPFRTGVGKTGIVATLDSGRPGPVVAMRADMDALPLEEKNDVPYKSQCAGRMHACGHDAHMTIALGAARWLVEQERWFERGSGKLVLVFQPAEEGGAGARAMLDSGALDGEPIAAIFAGHLCPELPMGHIGMAPGPSNAACDTLSIRIEGKGGHGAQPHLCVDPIIAGAHLVTQLQSIISRNISPLDSSVITIGSFHAGTASNIIPDIAEMKGTLRTLDPEVRQTALRRIEDILKGLETSFNVKTELGVKEGYPVLINDVGLVHWIAERAGDLLGPDNVHMGLPKMGAEDFAYFLHRYPGVLIRVGCHRPEEGFTHGLHSPYFSIDERVLDVGARLFSRLLTDRIKEGGTTE